MQLFNLEISSRSRGYIGSFPNRPCLPRSAVLFNGLGDAKRKWSFGLMVGALSDNSSQYYVRFAPHYLGWLHLSALLLLHVSWQVIRCVIGVYECSVDNRDRFQDVAQALTEIVRVAESRRCIQDDIALDNELVTGVISLQALDLPNRLGEAHGKV